MEKTKAEIKAELKELKQKYLALETKYSEDINGFRNSG